MIEMALSPLDNKHALQIQAGTLGRKAGHEFEDTLTDKINNIDYPYFCSLNTNGHVYTGNPADIFLDYLCTTSNNIGIKEASAISTGALATSEQGKQWLKFNGVLIKRCKSDVLLNVRFLNEEKTQTFGLSVKQCNHTRPTNAQLFFTTARGFTSLLRENGIPVSNNALTSLRQFCGDPGFRPLDNDSALKNRQTDPRRYFWEEINQNGRFEWEKLFAQSQNDITRLLLQKAYLEDAFTPDFLLHKTKKSQSWHKTEVAIYSMDQLIDLSSKYGGFSTKTYTVRKGAHKDPTGIKHLAPRFGIVQMQRGGQKQHPDQLQFNLEAGYFYKISK